MTDDKLKQLIARGEAAVDSGNTTLAMVHFEEAASIRDTPEVRSYRGYCLAREHGRIQEGAGLCLSAMQQEPLNSVPYLNLGRIYLLADQKTKAIRTFRRGLRIEQNRRIIAELKNLGLRGTPIFSSLDREHPLNRFLGKLFKAIGLR